MWLRTIISAWPISFLSCALTLFSFYFVLTYFFLSCALALFYISLATITIYFLSCDHTLIIFFLSWPLQSFLLRFSLAPPVCIVSPRTSVRLFSRYSHAPVRAFHSLFYFLTRVILSRPASHYIGSCHYFLTLSPQCVSSVRTYTCLAMYDIVVFFVSLPLALLARAPFALFARILVRYIFSLSLFSFRSRLTSSARHSRVILSWWSYASYFLCACTQHFALPWLLVTVLLSPHCFLFVLFFNSFSLQHLPPFEHAVYFFYLR